MNPAAPPGPSSAPRHLAHVLRGAGGALTAPPTSAFQQHREPLVVALMRQDGTAPAPGNERIRLMKRCRMRKGLSGPLRDAADGLQTSIRQADLAARVAARVPEMERQACNVHRTTLSYRLNQVASLIGQDLNGPARFRIHAAPRLAQLSNL